MVWVNQNKHAWRMRVDTHVHFWEYDQQRDDWMETMPVLQQNYLPDNLVLTLEENNIDGCVAVQASQSEEETMFLVDLANKHQLIKGVVGWIDLQHENIEECLQHFSQYPIIKGWRHVVQGEPNDFLLRPNFQRGVKALQPFGYTYDILIYHHQLQPAIEFVSQFPEQQLVIDHCAKPDIANQQIHDWKNRMQEIAKAPNVYCKLSGLLTEAKLNDWTEADLHPYLDVVFDAFGVDRLLFGSDWPVVLVSGGYNSWVKVLNDYMRNFSETDKVKVVGKNAIRFYHL